MVEIKQNSLKSSPNKYKVPAFFEKCSLENVHDWMEKWHRSLFILGTSFLLIFWLLMAVLIFSSEIFPASSDLAVYLSKQQNRNELVAIFAASLLVAGLCFSIASCVPLTSLFIQISSFIWAFAVILGFAYFYKSSGILSTILVITILIIGWAGYAICRHLKSRWEKSVGLVHLDEKSGGIRNYGGRNPAPHHAQQIIVV